jgi:predicted permease
MNSFEAVIKLQGILFLLMFIGIILRKLSVIDGTGRVYLTDLLIDLVLPCNIINAFMIKFNGSILRASIIVLLVALVLQIFTWLIGKFIYLWIEPSKRSVLRYATMCSNAGFMGNPIVEGIFGAQGLMFASIYLIPLRFFMWTAGISCFTSMKLKEAVKKLALHPCIIAVWIGFAIMGTGVVLPDVLSKTIQYISGCNLPLSILVIGTILAEVNPRSLLDKTAVFYCFLRLLAIPGLVLAGCMLLHFDSVVTGVCVTLTCMPAGSTTAILAEKYGGDALYASKIILMSTILSLFSIPLFCWIIQTYLK